MNPLDIGRNLIPRGSGQNQWAPGFAGLQFLLEDPRLYQHLNYRFSAGNCLLFRVFINACKKAATTWGRISQISLPLAELHEDAGSFPFQGDLATLALERVEIRPGCYCLEMLHDNGVLTGNRAP